MKYCFLYIALLFSFCSFGQNLDKIGEEDMVTVSGGVNSNFVVNHTVNQEQFRDPLSWVLSGNVTVNILDVSLPFTFSFSNAGKSYSQPFNMTALHPTYKNWKTHLGITSMNFSPYTYSGMNFAGAGVEYTPKKWHVKAFGGRLKKAIEYDLEENNIHSVSYSRMGFGIGMAYKGKKFGTEILLFKAYENPASLDFYHNNPELTPKDNFVASVKANASLFKGLRLNGEIAGSILTRDLHAAAVDQQPFFLATLVNGNQSTTVTNAYNGSIDYRFKTFGVGLKYERIDPEYNTLGAVYFNNDLENITVNPSFSFWKNKVNIGISTGYQRNNLDQKNASESKRWIGTVNLSAQLIKGMSINANYSNLSSFSRRNPTADPFYTTFGDTLNYYQTSENMSASVNYSFGEKVLQSMNLTGSYSRSQNITGRLEDAAAFGFNVDMTSIDAPVDVYNGLFSHMFQFSKNGLGLGWMVNANHAIALGASNTYIGPGLNASKALLDKKMSLSLGTTYNQQYQNDNLQNHVINMRVGFRYNPELWDKKYGKLSMSLNGNWTNRLAVASIPNSQNITIIANIGYQF